MMVILSKDDCILLNYLIAELIANGVEFSFTNPFSNSYMHWVSNEDQVILVDSIVREAQVQKAVVYIGCVDHQPNDDYNTKNRNAVMIGYIPQENTSC